MGWTLALGVRLWPPSIALQFDRPEPEPDAELEPDGGGYVSDMPIEVTDTEGLEAERHLGFHHTTTTNFPHRRSTTNG